MRVQGSTSVAANASSGNVLAGKLAEFVERPSRIRFLGAAASIGLVGTIQAGPRTLMEESHVSQANRFPIDPDDRMVQDVAMPNTRLFLTFRNTTAGAIVVNWAVDVDVIG